MADQYFITQDGKLKAVGPEAVKLAVDSGWKPLGTDLEQARAVRDAGSWGGAAKSFGEQAATGLVNAATALPRAAAAGLQATGLASGNPIADMTGENLMGVGQSAITQAQGGDELQGQAAAQQYRGNMAMRAEANPIAAGAGTLAGSAVGMELGGLGALGAAAKGATAARLGAGALGRVAAGAAEGAAIGAPLGLSDASAKAAQENAELTGQQAAASLALGLVTGAGFGAALPALGEAAGAGKRGLSSIFGKLTGAAGDAADSTGPGVVSRAMGAISGKDPDTIASMLEQSPAGRQRRNLAVFEGDSTREGAERAIRSNINQLETATKNLTPEWRELKASNVAATVDRSPEAVAQQTAMVTDKLATMREQVDAMVGDKDVYGDRGNLKRIERALNVAEKNVNAAAEAGDSAGMFVEMDKLKKAVGSASSPGQFLSASADKETARAARLLHDELREVLVHPAWGEAGEMQQQVNGAFQDYLGTKRLFDKRFMTETGREGWEKSYGADPEKVASYVRGLTDPAKDLDHSVIEQHIESTRKLAQALASAGELTPAKAAELNTISKAAEDFSTHIASASDALSATNKLDRLKGGGAHGIGVGAALGHSVGGVAGGALGAILGAAADPGAMVQRMAVAERLAAPIMERSKAAVDSLFAGIGKVGEVGAVARPAGLMTGLQLFTGSHESPAAAYPKRVEQLAQAPAAMADRLGKVFAADGTHDPATVLAAYASANKAVEFLQSKIPVGLYDMHSLTPRASQPTPAGSDIAEFASLWSAVMRPRDVLAGIPHGVVSSGQIQAIQTVYPALYENIRKMAMDHVERLDGEGHQVPMRQREILDSLFDLGALAGPTYTLEFAGKFGPRMGDKAQMQGNKQHPPTRGTALGSKRVGTATSTMIGSTT